MNTINTATKNNDTKENKQFNKVYDLIEKEIPFSLNWKNGTGYYNYAVHSVSLASGEYVKSYCPESDRKMIFIGTVLGTIVIFERYSFGDDGVFVSNCNYEIKRLRLDIFPDGRFSEWQLSQIFGIWGGKREDGSTWKGEAGIAGHLEDMAAIFDRNNPRYNDKHLVKNNETVIG